MGEGVARGALVAQPLSVLSYARMPVAFALLWLGFPPAAVPVAALIFMVPLILEAGDARHRLGRRGVHVFVTCAAVGLTKFWWLGGSLTVSIGAPPLAGMIVVATYVTAVAAAYTACFILPQLLRPVLRLPATALMLATCTIALPWPLPVSFAHGVLDLPALAGLAALGGVAAVDLGIVATNVLVAAALTGPRRRRAALLLGGALLPAFAGWLALPRPGPPPGDAAPLRIALLQPDVPLFRDLVADPALRAAMQDRVFDMMAEAAAATPRPDLIVLPEYPFLFHYLLQAEERARLDGFAAAHGIPVLLTAFRGTGGGRVTSATAIAGDPTGTFTDKQLLFPFGEYLPGEAIFPALRRAFPDAGRMTQGEPPRALPLPGTPVAIAALMCFDDTTTRIAATVLAALPRDRPAVAISVSNTESFGDDRARDLHLRLARYRAIETGMPLLRVGNDGHSGLVLPDGRMRADALPPGERAWRVLEVVPQLPGGDGAARADRLLRLLAGLSALGLLAAMLAARLGRGRRAG